MSRALRHRRRVTRPERDAFAQRIAKLLRCSHVDAEVIAMSAWRVARKLGTRPAIVRRVLLGRRVGAKAAGRLLAA